MSSSCLARDQSIPLAGGNSIPPSTRGAETVSRPGGQGADQDGDGWLRDL